ncbi:MAG: phosphatase PAP2 family protein [Candidatus Sulfotelmatobacter sp.]
MAWEKLTQPQQRESMLPLVGMSLVWTGLVIAAARLINFDEPYLPFAIAGAFAFFLRGAPSRWEIYAWLSISVIFVKLIHLSQIPFWVLRVASGIALLGFGALLLLGLRAVWSEREGRENALALVVPALTLIFFILVSGSVLRFSGALHPQTEDAWLYAFDGSLGFQPSFFVGTIMFKSLVLTRSALLTYLSLPFAMAVVCAWQIPLGARRISWHTLTVLLIAGLAGWVLYNVVPGTGPLYAFGLDFPWHPLPYGDLWRFPLQKMAIPLNIPRNAMPSLHVGWAVLLVWNSRGFPRVLRAALILYLLLTVVATLGGGQHYLVDLVASLPFALAVQAAASYTSPNMSRQVSALTVGVAFTALWLFMVRFGVALALKSPAIPWTLIVTTTSISIWLERRMSESGSNGSLTGNIPQLELCSQPSADEKSSLPNRSRVSRARLSKGHSAGNSMP